MDAMYAGPAKRARVRSEIAAARIAILSALLVLASVATSGATQVLTVQANGDLGPFPPLASGFIHGLDEQGALDSVAVAPLAPAFWRIYKYVTYDLASGFDAKITYELANNYAWSQGGFPQARPWEDWAGWEQYVSDMVAAILFWFPEDRPLFYDVWNEPDLAYFWSGTYAQLLELFARTHAVVKSADPNARVVGPSVAKYDPFSSGVSDLVQFATDLDQQYGVRLDALSWHENDSGVFGDGADKPEDIPGHAASIRTRLAAGFAPEYQPELHINEYSGNRVHLSPGYTVGYLYYMMQAGVDWASRSCWTVYGGGAPPYEYWSDCWSGLDGMFMNDGRTPQIVYWVHEAAARMHGGTRLPTTSPRKRTNIIASRIDEGEEIRILVGRHQVEAIRDVLVRVEDWPWSDAVVHVDAGRIPHQPELFDDPPKAIPWPDGPVDTWTAALPVVDGVVEVPLDGFLPNDVWSVVLRRDPATDVAGIGPSDITRLIHGVYPNPLSSRAEILLSLPEPARVRVELFDVTGRRAARLLDAALPAGLRSVEWSATDALGRRLSPGIYFLRAEAGGRVEMSRITVIR